VADPPFVAGDIADRGPLERDDAPLPEPRARDAREWQRQQAWRDQAARAIDQLKVEEGTAPVNADDLDADDEAVADPALERVVIEDEDGGVLRVEGAGSLPTLRVLPHGVSRKRSSRRSASSSSVIIARDVDEADVVMTLRSEYARDADAPRGRGAAMPIYVLKSNTVPQMQSSLTSIFSLEIDPREAAMRETEEAIGIVLNNSEPVELSPQNAYIRRLQHQMAERANIVSRSRGREPFRRVRLYPDTARSSWR
jgi:hypothetical protein